MTNDGKNIRCAINYLEELKCHTSGYAVEWLDMSIKALEQQPCDDCVSRQAAIEVIYDKYYDNAIAHDIVGMLFDLPSVSPQRPQGKWIEQNDTSKHHFRWYYCSNCGAYLMSADGANYCSCCGSLNGGKTDGNE
jgi:hypothetical protein